MSRDRTFDLQRVNAERRKRGKRPLTPAITQRPDGFYCNKCGRMCESVSIERSWTRMHDYIAPTGEVIVTVECHGERIKFSNWHGVLEVTI